ncbi:MAG: hypothetical protein QOD83_2003, partial [Solirubrobacteraceae bacterium]|nr:hypothetical protein [Solirubrobacteraceae bacterium]
MLVTCRREPPGTYRSLNVRAIVYPYKVRAARAAEAAAAAETEGERRQDDGPTYYAGR